MSERTDIKKVRLDRWLVAARFYKTRGLAAEAVAGGKVQLNGKRTKRSHSVGPGDRVRIRKGPYEHDLEVKAVAERRGPAEKARTLYEESPESVKAREEIAAQMKAAAPAPYHGKGRPTKKQRRSMESFRRSEKE